MSGFVFQWPAALALLSLLVPLAWLLARARRKRVELIGGLGGAAGVPRGGRDRWRLAALALMVAALARPGDHPRRLSASSSGRDVVFVLDVSRSMLARDAPPSRLEVGKQAIRDALDSFQGERAGLVIYAGSASILCPLTRDYVFVRYMLDQATPRRVDFGGTQLIAAVEKAVDQVFLSGREGFQDLVVLTDGEDHGPGYEQVRERLASSKAGLLVIGLGDAARGARIPVEREDGGTAWLEFEGRPVETRLDDAALRTLASMAADAVYVPAGTAPFDLGEIYAGYAVNRPAGSSSKDDAALVYRELAFGILPVALLLLLAAEWRYRRRLNRLAAVGALLLGMAAGPRPVAASEMRLQSDIREAIGLHREGRTAEAMDSYTDVLREAGGLPSSWLAVVEFNRGLCFLDRAATNKGRSAREALTDAEQAQRCFLHAKRVAPGFDRAGMRLDAVAGLIQEYAAQIEKEEAQAAKAREAMADLIARIEELLEAQVELHGRVPDPTRKARKKGPNPAAGKPATPIDRPGGPGFAAEQTGLAQSGGRIEKRMKELDRKLSVSPPGQPPIESVLKEPLVLMASAVEAQDKAAGWLADRAEWPLARREQATAIRKLEDLLRMLSNGNASDGEAGDMDEDERDLSEPGESDESRMSSMPARGDFARSGEMQPLPTPNYTLEDILGEEAANQQFREEKRAKSSAGKVKKDW